MPSLPTLSVESNPDGSARLRLSGYSVYAYVAPNGDGTFSVSLKDHLTGFSKPVSQAQDSAGGVSSAQQALVFQAKSDGVDTSGLQVIA